ncbi:MAG: hypothetical protein ACYS76_09735 [Planctomycetota bacterium]
MKKINLVDRFLLELVDIQIELVDRYLKLSLMSDISYEKYKYKREANSILEESKEIMENLTEQYGGK